MAIAAQSLRLTTIATVGKTVGPRSSPIYRLRFTTTTTTTIGTVNWFGAYFCCLIFAQAHGLSFALECGTDHSPGDHRLGRLPCYLHSMGAGGTEQGLRSNAWPRVQTRRRRGLSVDARPHSRQRQGPWQGLAGWTSTHHLAPEGLEERCEESSERFGQGCQEFARRGVSCTHSVYPLPP